MNTKLLNQPEVLKKRFFGDNPNTLQEFRVSDGSEIRLHHATGPYTPHHFMLIMHSPEFSTYPEGQTIETENFYDFNPEAQQSFKYESTA